MSQPYSIFILHDNGTWEQPTFCVENGDRLSLDEIEKCAQNQFGGFLSYGLQSDDDAPEENICEIPNPINKKA
jgi:hypothetical protein